MHECWEFFYLVLIHWVLVCKGGSVCSGVHVVFTVCYTSSKLYAECIA